MTERRLAVVGWPIEHSRSPALHGAAALALGLDWRYDRVPVPRGGLAAFVGGLGPEWLGLSVTAPHKDDAAALADELDPVARATGTANTLLLAGTGRPVRAWNTDVGGIVRAFADAGLAEVRTGAIIGAGATARAALVALARMGVERVVVALRSPAKAAPLALLAADLGVALDARALDEPLPGVDAAISTLPAEADAVPVFAAPPTRLLDADYARPAGSRYRGTLPAGTVVDGREMLLGQAVLQARVFALGEVDAELPDEAAVVAAMRSAITDPPSGVRASDSLEES